MKIGGYGHPGFGRLLVYTIWVLSCFSISLTLSVAILDVGGRCDPTREVAPLEIGKLLKYRLPRSPVSLVQTIVTPKEK